MQATTATTTTTAAAADPAPASHWLEDTYEAWQFCQDFDNGARAADLSMDARRLLKEHGWDGSNPEDTAEALAEVCREAALEIAVRTDWHAPHEAGEVTEYQVLLSWGGPSSRIIGSLNKWGTPSTASYQRQDWFKPWEDDGSVDEDACLWFASLFYWGEA